jgi:HEAT repeat protein
MAQAQRMRILALTAVITAVLTGGCFLGGPPPLPKWAIHVEPPRINTEAEVGDAIPKLIADLQHPGLTKGYTSAEQVAVLAAREIKSGHTLDALVLLTYSSYRYHQQAKAAVRWANATAEVHMRGRPPRAIEAYKELVRAEHDIFSSLDFDREIGLTFGVWQEKHGVFDKLKKGLAEITAGGPLYAKEDSERLFAEIEEARLAEWDELQRPALARALLDRLVEDVGNDAVRFTAGRYLGMVPLKKFQQAALSHANRYFATPICRQIVARYAAYRGLVLEALESERAKTRANAAMILALKAAPEDLPLLEQAYVEETDPGARLTLAFGLIRHGKEEHVPLLVSAAGDCQDEELCDLGIQLLQWLPIKLRVEIDQDLLAKILEGKTRSEWARFFAVVIIGNIGREREIGPRALRALIGATRHEDEDIAEAAARGIAWLEQLPRDDVVHKLTQPGADQQALMLRLAVVAEPADVPFFRRRVVGMKNADRLEREAIIYGLTRIADQSAEQLLVEIYKQHEELRLQVAIALFERRLPKAQLLQLAAMDDGPAGLFIALAKRSPGAVEQARQMLTGRDPDHRFKATHLVRVTGKTSLTKELRQLAGYHDPRYYPHDAFVRHGALMALLEFEVRRAVGAPMSLLEGEDSGSKHKPGD